MVVTHTAPSSSCSTSSVPGDRQPMLDLSEPGDRGQVEMVGSTSQPYGGLTFPLPMYDDDNRNVRLHGGVGLHPGNWVVSVEWLTAWAKCHISWLELQVVWLTLKHFLPQSGGAALEVLSDNATTVAYINKEGRTLSPFLCQLAFQVSTWCAGNTR